MIRNWAVLAALIGLGVATHLLPHDFGISTVGLTGMLCAAYLPRRMALFPVLITVVIADFYNSAGYALWAMAIVYVAHLLATLSIIPTLKVIGTRPVVIAALVNAFVFYLVSNLSQIQYQSYTVEGVTTVYVNGLPYLMRGILGNLVFGGIAFSLIYYGRLSYYARRIVNSQRN